MSTSGVGEVASATQRNALALCANMQTSLGEVDKRKHRRTGKKLEINYVQK